MTDPSPLDCRQAFARLDDFVDRELTPEELGQVEQHLATCAGCASHFRFEQDVLARVRQQVDRIHAPAGLLDRIIERLRAG